VKEILIKRQLPLPSPAVTTVFVLYLKTSRLSKLLAFNPHSTVTTIRQKVQNIINRASAIGAGDAATSPSKFLGGKID